MIKNTVAFCQKILLLSWFCGTALLAFEFREPLNLQQGPLRMIAEEVDSGFGLRYWSACYMRDAQRAFSSNHGTRTQDVAALFFSGDKIPKNDLRFEKGFNFRPTQMFEDWYISEKTSNYNPLLRTANLRLSVRYNEVGAVMGTTWDMPVVENASRIGFRASIPVKKIKVDKIDMEGVRQGAELQDVISQQSFAGGSAKLILVRMDFAEALVQSGDLNPALNLNYIAPAPAVGTRPGRADGFGQVKLASTDVNFRAGGAGTDPGIEIGAPDNNKTAGVVIISSLEGIVPRADGKAITSVESTNIIATAKQTYDDIRNLAIGDWAIFYTGNDYTKLQETGIGKALEERKLSQEDKAKLWLAVIVTPTGSALSTGDGGVLTTVETLTRRVTENVYEWFHDKKIDFEAFTNEGFGDLDMDFFVNMDLHKNLSVEGFVGFIAPTGGKVIWSNNPYKVNLGSGHWQFKAGGMVNWIPSKLLGVKLSGYYAHAMSAIEERHATFKNAIVKIGPKVDADVKWDYFVLNADINLSHFSAKDITGMVGYQFYYKRADTVKFKKDKVRTWLDMQRSPTGAWSEHEMTLDSKLAEANTNSISHRLRCEASFIMTDWLEFFAGGAWSFAGRNALRSTDAHVGFNVAF